MNLSIILNLTLKSTANKFTKEKNGKRLIQDSFNMYNIMQDAHSYFPFYNMLTKKYCKLPSLDVYLKMKSTRISDLRNRHIETC